MEREMSETKKIIAIACPDPRRDGEYGNGARVGYSLVDRIEAREQNLGTYGILWFDVYSGDRLLESYNAVNVEVVIYENDEQHS
jgi:hypothetical protein